MSTFNRLSEVFASAHEVAFNDSDKIVLFSDCHRGDGSWSDDFANNQNLFFHALNYYFQQGFALIEVGDGEELWENERFADIREEYDHIYSKMSDFYSRDFRQGRGLFLIWGNHNREWKHEKKVREHLYRYVKEDRRDDPIKDPIGSENPLFPDIEVHEGLKLRHTPTDKTIFVTHGHQGVLLNDGLWWLGRYIVRHVWRVLQVVAGFHDPTSPAKNNRVKRSVEEHIQDWAKARGQMIIVGHTHRPWFPRASEPRYFNCGSCVHPRCITGIEIDEGEIRLVKWSFSINVSDKGDQNTPLLIVRECIEKAPLRDCIP